MFQFLYDLSQTYCGLGDETFREFQFENLAFLIRNG